MNYKLPLALLTIVSFAAVLVQGIPMINMTLPSINEYRAMNQLPLLSWSKSLETTASQWVAKCPTTSMTTHHMIHVEKGEAAMYLPKVVQNAVIAWANEEIANKQLTWPRTVAIGCSIYSCFEGSILVLGCVFTPPYK